jgi:hypothetical protein
MSPHLSEEQMTRAEYNSETYHALAERLVQQRGWDEEEALAYVKQLAIREIEEEWERKRPSGVED